MRDGRRYRLTTISGASIVDAAHIHQFARSGNNSIDNGIALSKNAHWMFDLRLWSVADDFRVIVNHPRFDQWPNAVHLAWHRREHSRGS